MNAATEWLDKDTPWYNEAALERALDESELDAIVARSGRNVVYLSGMRLPGTLGRHQDFAWSPRPVLVVHPRDAEPTLVVNRFGEQLAERSSWIDDVRLFTAYTGSGWDVAVERLEELGIDDGRIGIERQEITVDDWAHLEAELAAATLVDCTSLMNRVRNVKSERELELLRESVAIQERAHFDVFDGAEPGDTENELHARMLESMVRRGAEWGHGMLQSSSVDITYGGEGPVPIETGDTVRTDYASYYRGYAANLSRMAVMGQPSAEQRDTYETVLEVHYGLLDETLRPGVKAQAVWESLRDRFHARGYERVGGLAGHSTGVWWHQEEPILRPGNDTELRPGMVVCLEPILNGYWHIQDQVLITSDGNEVLSDGFPIDELYVM